MENVWAAPRVQDALELLSEEFASPLKFPCRQFAVRQLHYVSEKDLRLYLLQLVQALRYEHFEAIERKKKLATINLGVKLVGTNLFTKIGIEKTYDSSKSVPHEGLESIKLSWNLAGFERFRKQQNDRTKSHTVPKKIPKWPLVSCCFLSSNIM